MIDFEKRNSKIFIIKIENKVFKIPHGLKSWEEMRREKSAIGEVKKDSWFASFLLEYKYFLGCSITDRLASFEGIARKEEIIERYFRDAFGGAGEWVSLPLAQMLDANFFLDFVSENIPDGRENLKFFLEKTFLPSSSTHGDFHQKNILVKNDKIFFIDWSYYKKNSSRYFDLLDFYVFDKGGKYESWTKVWEREFSRIPEKIFGIELPQNCFLAYGLWRLAEETKRLARQGELNKYKRKKFASLLNILIEKLPA